MKLEIEIGIKPEQPFNALSITSQNVTADNTTDEAELSGFISSFLLVLADQVNEHRRPGESMHSVLERLQRSDF
jgi:hypothetical protein